MAAIGERGSGYTLTAGQVCDIGHARDENQDSLADGQSPFGKLYVISDGVGGYKGGAEASRLIAAGMLRHLHAVAQTKTPEEALGEAVRRVNAEVFAAAQSGEAARRRMSATLVAALFVEQAGTLEAVIVNVGDSRAYLLRAGEMTLLSTDHTVVQAMVDANVLTTEQARNHPRSGVLSRSVGQAPEVEPSFNRVPLEGRDQILMCSDGLHSYVDAAVISETAGRMAETPETNAQALLALALAAGGKDNISIQLVRVEGSGTGSAAGVEPAVAVTTEAGQPVKPRRAIFAAAAVLGAMLLGGGGFAAYRLLGNAPAEAHLKPAPIDGKAPAPEPPAAVATAEPGPPAAASSTPPESASRAAKPGVSVAVKKPGHEPAQPVPKAAKLRVGWIAAGNDEAHRASYQRMKLGTMTEIAADKQAACLRFAKDKPAVFYKQASDLDGPAIEAFGVRGLHPLAYLQDPAIEQACGGYDLILLPARTVKARVVAGKQTVEAAAAEARQKLEDASQKVKQKVKPPQ